MFSLVFLLIVVVVQLDIVCGEEDLRPASERKAGDVAMTLDPGCADGACIGVANLYYLFDHTDPQWAMTAALFAQSQRALITWLREANRRGGVALRDGSKRKMFLKTYYFTESECK
jgi:hypothetical protein